MERKWSRVEKLMKKLWRSLSILNDLNLQNGNKVKEKPDGKERRKEDDLDSILTSPTTKSDVLGSEVIEKDTVEHSKEVQR